MTKVTKVAQIFICKECGNVVEVKEVGGGELYCCGRSMREEKKNYNEDEE